MLDPFKSIVWDGLVTAVLREIFKSIPLLSWGPISFLLTHIVMKFTDLLYHYAKDYLNLNAIAMRNEEHQKAYSVDSIKLRSIARQHGVDSDEYRQAEKEFLKSFVDLVTVRV